jgi:hypothetical protein
MMKKNRKVTIVSRVTKGIPEWQTGIADWHSDGEYNHIITMLNIYNEAPSVYERYDKYAWSEPIRFPEASYCADRDLSRPAMAQSAWRSKPKWKK